MFDENLPQAIQSDEEGLHMDGKRGPSQKQLLLTMNNARKGRVGDSSTAGTAKWRRDLLGDSTGASARVCGTSRSHRILLNFGHKVETKAISPLQKMPREKRKIKKQLPNKFMYHLKYFVL